MGSSDMFCLKWESFQTNMISSFDQIRKDPEFSDVTLSCDGENNFEAHKIILTSSSSFFSKLLKKSSHPHPLLYMRGIDTRHLSAVLDFIYYGQVRLFHDDLDAFFILAEELELRGLSGSEKESQQSPFLETCLKEQQPLGLNQFSVLDQDRLKSKHPQVKPEATEIQSPNDTNFVAVSDLIPDSGLGEQNIMVQADDIDKPTNHIFDSNAVQLDDQIDSMMERLGHGKFSCKVCGKTINHKGHMISHIEHKHIQGVTHQCPKCGKPYRSRGSLQVHVSLHHRA